MIYHFSNSIIARQALALISPELQHATCGTDLRRRLARLGYNYRDTPRGRMLTTMPHGVDVTPMPALYAAPLTP